MSANSEFLVAKYIPIVERMEPRNVGVILWTPEKPKFKFLGEDSRPKFVRKKDYPVYINWLDYWKIKIRKHASDFDTLVKELRRSTRSNFVLAKAGFIPHEVDPENAIDWLYEKMVEGHGVHDEREKQPRQILKKKCDDFFEETKIKSHENFHENYKIEKDVFGVANKMPFHYGIGFEGSQSGLFEKDPSTFSNDRSFTAARMAKHCIQFSKCYQRSRQNR